VRIEEFRRRLELGGTVPLSALEWNAIAGSFPVEERHQTQLAGELLIVRVGKDLAAVEAPSRDARVARILGGPDEARAFVSRRMEEYERMWDGCGVKVDYFEDVRRDGGR
jgi:hypothetical protein